MKWWVMLKNEEKKELIMFKVGFKKVYDFVKCGYLDYINKNMGFLMR